MADQNAGGGTPSGPGRLFIRKSVEQMHAEHEASELRRSLGPVNLVLLGIGCIIGTGIFVLTGRAAAEFAGPGIVISFIITGTLCGLVALCYAELASAIPVSGSAYSYAYASMGEIVAWLMGVLLVLEYGLAASTVAVGWSGYLASLLDSLGITLPHAFTQAPGALVVTEAINVTIANPTLDLNGAHIATADGARMIVQSSNALAQLSGGTPVEFEEFAVVGRTVVDLTTQSGAASLVNGVTALPMDGGAARELAAGTTVTFYEATKATLTPETVRAAVEGSVVPSIFNAPALLAITAVCGLLAVGVKESTVVNNVLTFVKLAVVIGFIAIGVFFVNPDLWTPLVPAQVPAPPPGTDMSLGAQILRALGDVLTGQEQAQYGVGGLIAGAAVIFFAYIGFEAVSTAGAESRNPSRDMPIGIIGSLLICTLLYILTAGVLVGIVPYQNLNTAAPIAVAVNQMGLPWFAILVKIGAIAGLSSVMLVLLYAQTRVFYTMARDGLLPSAFARIHPRFKTPVINTMLVGVVAAAFAGFMSLDALANLTNVGSLSAFAMVCLTVLYLRYARPDMKRPFRTPWFPFVPLLGAAMCLFLVMSLMGHEATRNFFLIYLAIGFALYFVYGVRKSKLAHGERVTGHEPAPLLDLPDREA